MMRRVGTGLAGAAVAAVTAALVWLPLLALCALTFGWEGVFDADGLAGHLRTANGAVLVSVLPALGLIQGGITGAARGRADGPALLEALLSPFAWILTAGEGMMGAVLVFASLLPGACLGALAGLWLAGVPTDARYWPKEAGVGAVVGAAALLVGLNLYVQWPTLRGGRREERP
jgi:hypothetical protein